MYIYIYVFLYIYTHIHTEICHLCYRASIMSFGDAVLCSSKLFLSAGLPSCAFQCAGSFPHDLTVAAAASGGRGRSSHSGATRASSSIGEEGVI